MELFEEIQNACKIHKVSCEILSKEDANKYLNDVFTKFDVHKKFGHLSIGYNVEKIFTEEYELVYSNYLDEEPIFIFFDQDRYKQKVIRIGSSKKFHSILEDCYGFEYFLSNESIDYLISVNWYVIEATGNQIKNVFKELQEKSGSMPED